MSRTHRWMNQWQGSLAAGIVLSLCTAVSLAQALPRCDFTKAEVCRQWAPTNDVSSLKASPEGLVITISGRDPYIAGPVMDLPSDQLLWLRLRLKSEQGGMAQLFYFKGAATEQDSLRLPVRAGVWEEFQVAMPALDKGYRLRLDPPGDAGQTTVSLLAFEPRIPLKEPAWAKPVAPAIRPDSPKVRSGQLELAHAADELGGFVVSFEGQQLAIGFNRPMLGYLQGDQQRWMDLKQAANVNVRAEGAAVLVSASTTDPDGATWKIEQRFTPAAQAPAIDVETIVTVDRDRAAAYVPAFAIVAGPGWIGQSKKQALFAGLEYLDKDEPSSSEADLIGPGAKRQVPDSIKITFPLMTVLGDGKYIGLVWNQHPAVSAVFDSPDRLFKSGGHLMGLVFPGSNGKNRIEGSLLPHWPDSLFAGRPLKVRATIIAGKGTSVVPAIQQYVSLRGLPDVPDIGMDLQGYVKLTAAGWMDSMIREGDRFRHAYPGGFQPQPAADAAMWMDWLAAKTSDQALARQLSQRATAAIAQVDAANYNAAAVSHVRYPVASLLYGHVAENAARARQHGRALLGRFEPDGTVLYKPSREFDFGKTHFAPDANGLTATIVMSLLDSASVCGDKALLEQALKMLRAMDKFTDTVPRGAQTWECPLHIPDVLASAYLVHAYVRGYELSGDDKLLETARYWASTGVPFVYLINPADRPAGPYATIAVYGATHWKAPNWMGLPVQWCGLVYAHSLYELMRHDSSGPWKKLADGITASGIQQTWPIGSDPQRQGLLPDSFVLRSGQRNDAAINPGTVQANAAKLFGQPDVYSFRSLLRSRLLVHAPAELSRVTDTPDGASFQVGRCIREKYDVLVAGCGDSPRLRINGADAAPGDFEHLKDAGLLIVHLKGDATVDLKLK